MATTSIYVRAERVDVTEPCRQRLLVLPSNPKLRAGVAPCPTVITSSMLKSLAQW
jgi:hypothetical protein